MTGAVEALLAEDAAERGQVWTARRRELVRRVEDGKRVSLFTPYDYAAVEVLAECGRAQAEERGAEGWRLTWFAWDGRSNRVTYVHYDGTELLAERAERHDHTREIERNISLFLPFNTEARAGATMVTRGAGEMAWEEKLGVPSDIDLNMRVLARVGSRGA